MTGPGMGVARRREAADVGVPEHGVDALDRAALDGAGVHALAGLLAEIGLQQGRGDDVAGIRLYRQRQARQRRLQQRHVVVRETAAPVGGEGINDSGPMRAVAVLAEAE